MDYFQYDSIKAIARIFANLDGINLESKVDPLRIPLMAATGLPFAVPSDYTVWRNYKRVFGCELLATKIDSNLVCTQLCLDLSKGTQSITTVDDYLAHVARVFYYPSPIFEGYNSASAQVFPFCAILKLLAAKSISNGSGFITIDDIFNLLIANSITGKEPLTTYVTLTKKAISSSVDKRQVRELVRFMSQFSFLKWENPKLYLDVATLSEEFAGELEKLATPLVRTRNTDRAQEVLSLGQVLTMPGIQIPEMKDRIYNEDIEFIEGHKVRVTHLRSERSRKLRQIFFASRNPPYDCDICALRMKSRYPWTDNLLEVHHLLPLSSPIKFGSGKTSIKDLVELCPSCHRAIHDFYRRWLGTEGQDDFTSYDEARSVYKQAKEEVVLS